MLSDGDINKILTTFEEIQNIIKDTEIHGLYDEYRDIWNKSYMGIEYSKTLDCLTETIDVFLDINNPILLKTITYNSSLYEKYLKDVPSLIKQNLNIIIKNPMEAKRTKLYNFDNKSYSTDAFGYLNILYHVLNLTILHFGLDLRTKSKFPGYNTKIRQLNSLITEIENQKNNLYEAETIYEEILKISKEVEKAKQSLKEIQKIESTSKELLESIQEQLEETGEKIKKAQEKTENLLKEIEKYESEAKNNNEEVSRIKGQIKNFFDDIESYKEEIEDIKKKIKTTIEEYENKTNEIIKENENLQKSIQELLKKAIAGSLFESFEKRKESLQKPLKIWLIALGILIFVAMVIAVKIYLDLKSASINIPLLILKISILAPIIYAIYFVTKRYTQERQLTEEYAFKSTVSLSMNAFNDLLKKYQDKGISDKQLELMINTIDNLFQSPTDKVFKKDSTKEEKQLIDNFINTIKDIKENISKTNN